MAWQWILTVFLLFKHMLLFDQICFFINLNWLMSGVRNCVTAQWKWNNGKWLASSGRHDDRHRKMGNRYQTKDKKQKPAPQRLHTYFEVIWIRQSSLMCSKDTIQIILCLIKVSNSDTKLNDKILTNWMQSE